MLLRIVQSPSHPVRHAWVSDFRGELDAQYRRLKHPLPVVIEALGVPGDNELLVYFGVAPWNDADDPTHTAELEQYARDAVRLLPVIEHAKQATTHLATSLQRFNAFIQERAHLAFAEALVDEVMTLLWQRRRRRRIFISYRRSESLEIARQLHDRYTQRSFDVFLDERSIEPGVDVQRSLEHELDDCDAVLLLVSPGIDASSWVRKEIQFANTHRVGLLGVVWPNSSRSAAAAELGPDQRFELAIARGASEHLSDDEVAGVDRLLFTGRAMAVAGRIRDLIDVVDLELPASFTVHSRDVSGDIVLDRAGQRWRGRVVPFRPSVLELWQWWRELRSAPTIDGLLVVYPCVPSDNPSEQAFRAICDQWGSSVSPRVEFLRVHL